MMIALIASGAVVGLLVGITGMGGGSLMTPILILFFGMHPMSAVGSDLLFAAVTKSAGAQVHHRFGQVNLHLLSWLLAGSVPTTLLVLAVMARLPMRSAVLTKGLTYGIALVLILAAVSLLIRDFPVPGLCHSEAPTHKPDATVRALPTLSIGVLLGALVSLTSVGAGALGMAILLRLYPQQRPASLVGTDIAHAVPLTLIAGSGHWLLGDVEWHYVGPLVLGSVPGIVLGSLFAGYLSERRLRHILGLVLLGVSTPLLLH